MLFSIIIVTYNAERYIEETLVSLSKQVYTDYEVIIIDGDSKDGTLLIINSYKKFFKNIIIVSERDSGIYNAMNKGISHVNGDFIYFLNSGDTLYNDFVLQDIAHEIQIRKSKKIDISNCIFHGTICKNGNLITYPYTFKEWKWVYMERCYFCHQAIFASADTLKNNLFDEKLKICSDRDWIIRIMRKGCKYIYLPNVVVANYLDGGVSSGFKSQQLDSLIISRRYGGYKAYMFVKFKRLIGELLGHAR